MTIGKEFGLLEVYVTLKGIISLFLVGNNEHKHRDYTISKKKKKKLHKEKIKTTTRGNDMKKVQVQKQEERLTTIKRKTPE